MCQIFVIILADWLPKTVLFWETKGVDLVERSEPLLRLAEANRVSTEYWAFDGSLRLVDGETLVKTLDALGIDASTPEKIDAALVAADEAPWLDALPPTVIAREGQSVRVPVHVTDGVNVEVWIELGPENGNARWETWQVDNWDAPRYIDGRLIGRAEFELPSELPLGWHTLHAKSSDGEFTSTLIVTPNTVPLYGKVKDGRAWGFMSQIYSVRSKHSWGVGDYIDTADTAWYSGELGADFLLINPVHAGEVAAPLSPSPYLPTTRRFVNPTYIRPDNILEVAYLNASDRASIEALARKAYKMNPLSTPIDRDASWALKIKALEIIYSVKRSSIREAKFEAFKKREGKGLEDYALWCAINEEYPIGEWPAPLRDYRSAAVASARKELAPRLDFFAWLQWIADEQLGAAQAAALEGGMEIGIMHDLAVGVHPDGVDAWSLHDAMATGASVGAPPDMYNQQGQNWSQPPWNPRALAKLGYKPYRDMLRTVLRHAGALRIDHVIGLFRLWWIPTGLGADQGAYVSYDHDAIIGILALEAYQAGAIVIGEDLGTFESWVRDYLTDRGFLGTSILWFEKDEQGGPLAPERQRVMALNTVTTHDLPPTAGYLAGEHVKLRESLGLLADPVEQVQAEADAEREAMLQLLKERGLIGENPSEQELIEALYGVIALSPSKLLGVSIVDAVGEHRTQNQPGTDQEYPNWKIPLGDETGKTVLLDDFIHSKRVRSLARVFDSI